MKSLLLFVFLAIIATGYADLKCYKCDDKEDECTKDKLKDGDKDKYQMTCTAGMDRCIRTWIKKDDETRVFNSCSSEAQCTTAKEACDKIESDNEGECAVDCCTEELCNASSIVSFSVVLMAACSVFGLALMK